MAPACKSLQRLGFPILLAATAWLAACGKEEVSTPAEGQGPPPVTVEIVTVGPERLRDVVDFVGQLDAAGSVEIRAETEGVIEAIGFQEGEMVEQGQVLFSLRNAEQKARLRLAEAELAKVEAEYRRTEKLAKRAAASAAQLERQAAEREIAEASVELARIRLEQTYVRAPFSGVTGLRKVWIGDRVDEKTSLIRLDDITRLQLFFSLPETVIPTAHPGAKLTVSVAPYPGETWPGEVFFVAPHLDPQTRRLSVKAWVPNPGGKLRPGLFANIRAVLDEREGALLVPEAALVHDRNGTFVWRVAEGGKAERVPVEQGLRVEGRVEILSGLAPGDRVVAAGTNKVKEGAPVRTPAERTAERSDAAPPTPQGSGT